MICCDESSAKLQAYAQEFGIDTDEHQRTLLLKHLDLVVEKNKVVNLTRIVDPEEAIVLHVVDSLLLASHISFGTGENKARFVDVGTGAGFPGIPLGIVTGCHGVLIDSVGKKVNAVNEFIHELGLQDRLVGKTIRAEELAKEQRGSFDVVTARAVADLGVLVEYASPLLRKGGQLVVSKARISDEEIDRGKRTGALTGMAYVSRETYELPHDLGHREILVLERHGQSKVKLPRQNGMAKNKPLVQ